MQKVLLYNGGMKVVGKSGVGRAMEHQARALENAGIPYTFDAKDDYAVVHLNTVFPDSLWMSVKAHMQRKAVVYYGHSTMEDFRNSFVGSNMAAGLFRRWISRCYGSGDVIITPTPYSARLLRSYGINKPIVPLSNGIDLAAYKKSEEGARRFRETYCIPSSRKVVLGVGHYIERKGILDFVEMAKRYPQYEFIWFGSTPTALIPPRIRKAVRTQLPNLQFPGYISKEKLMDAYSGSDLFFFPTLEETEGIVMLEAMAMHTPVLVRDIPVYEGWLTHGKTVYKGKKQDDFERLIPAILEKQLPDLTEEAYRLVGDNSIGKIGTALAEIYSGLLEEGTYENSNYNRLV